MTPQSSGQKPLTDFVAFSYPVDRIKLLFDINVHGVFYTAREAARNMIPAGGGSIILIASMSANVSFRSALGMSTTMMITYILLR